MRRLIGTLAFAAAVSTVGVSHAHIELTSPAPRYTGNNTQKTGPCGMPNDTRGNNITYLEPGSTITVEWYETVNHPGHYRIMFDDDGFDDFTVPAAYDDYCIPGTDTGCLADNIADAAGGAGTYSQDVTLPNIECDNCTLQVIQMMTDKQPYGDGNDIYFRCADLVLQMGAGGGPSTTTSTTSSSGSGAGGAGTTSSTGANTGSGGDNTSSGAGAFGEHPEEDSGCSLGGAGGAPTSAALAALALLGLAVRDRRRRAA